MLSPAIVGGIVGGIAGGLAVAGWALLQSPKTCPECDTPLPKIRKPQNNHQRMWGGWTCSECNCEIDRKGQKRIIKS